MSVSQPRPDDGSGYIDVAAHRADTRAIAEHTSLIAAAEARERTEHALDRLLDALVCCAQQGIDPFCEPRGQDHALEVGSCSACGYPMLASAVRQEQTFGPDGWAWRPHTFGRQVACPGDDRTYVDLDGSTRTIGNCTARTWLPWAPARTTS